MEITGETMGRERQKGFWALIATQFQGAFNDNLYRFLIVFFICGKLGGDEHTTMLVTSFTVVLIALAYLVVPGIAGAFSDRFSKRGVCIGTKVWEVGVMILGLMAFLSEDPYFIYGMLALMFLQSAFFSPAKYGILPEILPESRLSWGNGILNGTTFVAIIAGQFLAGPLYAQIPPGGFSMAMLSIGLIVLSGMGLAASFFITKTPAANPAQRIPFNPWAGLGRHFRMYYSNRVLWLMMLGATFFWMSGAILQVGLISHAKDTLQAGEMGVSLHLVSLLAGIALGSAAAGFISRGKIELGLIPIGLLGMAAAGLLLGWPGFGFRSAMALLGVLGFFGGFFDVPVMAYIQHRTPAGMRGGIIATLNVATNVGILLGGGLGLAFGKAHLSTYAVFFFVGLMTIAVAVYLFYAYPYFFLRSLFWLIFNTVYRIHVRGRANVPEEGGALFVANHMSYIDAPFIAASTDRQVRFLMSSELLESHPWMRPLARIGEAITVSPHDSPKNLVEALRAARKAIQEGHVVCVFAEGQITRTGQMLPFQKGFEKIMKGVNAPIIPICLDRLWGSLFSFSEGRVLWKMPRQIPFPVSVSYGEAMPPDSPAVEVRNRIREIGTDTWLERKLHQPILHRAFVRNARLHLSRRCMADATTPVLSYGKALIASVIFARKLNVLLGDESAVGVLVPPSVGGVITNIALQLMGKVPVNLNYTAANSAIASAVRQCGIRQVITSKRVLEKLTQLEVPGETLFLEDIKASVRINDKLLAMLMAFLLPVRLLEKAVGRKKRPLPDDVAAIIFSSGSEGEPKGVPLTQFNMSSNIESILQVFPHDKDECMVGILPFFHSFGLTVSLWLTMCSGWSAVYHPSPLEAKAVGQLIYKYHATFLVAAPTFLQNFVRRCLPEELSSIRHALTGAEKLSPRLREAFRAKFGIEPLEGYGTTECSPVVSVNLPDYRAPGFFQVGVKNGTIGQPIPGVSVRVVDPDTGKLLPPNEPGMLLVRGPNVMKGYLGLPEKTAEVMKDGWYRTGDIAKVDEEGFITITDRLSRFSKIGGEMAPHAKIEETMHQLLGLSDMSMAVTGVPDAIKGEHLVVIHTLDEEQLEVLFTKLDTCDLPRLWVPRSSSFYRVAEIPVLGTGKMNLRAIKDLARMLDINGD